MQYTTTKCPHCGYRTRNRESGVPKVEIGQTIACCPKCDKPIIDTVYTEYEFMSKREQKKFSTSHISTAETISGIFKLILGGVLFIILIITGGGWNIAVAFLLAGGLAWMGIDNFKSAEKARELHIGEQLIYESLLRTSNKRYVELLKKTYGKERTYKTLPNRFEIIDDYKKHSTEEIHKRFEDEFLKLLNVIGYDDKEIEAKKANSSSSFVKGGALVAGVMAIPSAITGAKQNKELEKKNSNEKKLAEEKISKYREKNTIKKLETTNKQQIKTTEAKLLEKVNKNKLLELKELFNEGLITEEEYNEKRKKILEKL